LEQLPKFVEDKISQIQQRMESTREEVLTEYKEIFNDPSVSNDTQFSSIESRQRYAIAVLWARYVSRPPVKKYDVIPCGFDSLRKTRTNKLMSALYVVVRDEINQSVLRRISLLGASKVATLYRNVNILSENGAYRYTTKLGSFGKGDDFIADNRTKFNSPKKINLTPEKFREMLNIPLLKIAELVEHPSRKRSDGYVINTDWRCVKGIIADEMKGTRKDSDLEWGIYRITDETTPAEPYVTSDGRTISPALTCWTPPELMVFEPESQCEFYGSVTVDKDSIPSMNVNLIVPVYAKEKEIEEKA
jgi:hypothetical protein